MLPSDKQINILLNHRNHIYTFHLYFVCYFNISYSIFLLKNYSLLLYRIYNSLCQSCPGAARKKFSVKRILPIFYNFNLFLLQTFSETWEASLREFIFSEAPEFVYLECHFIFIINLNTKLERKFWFSFLYWSSEIKHQTKWFSNPCTQMAICFFLRNWN